MASKLKLTELLYPTSTTPAITINADDTVTFGAPTTTITNLAYTGTLTGGTGILNIGSGQVYKDASGNVGVGTAAPVGKVDSVSNAYAAFVARASSGGVGQTVNALTAIDAAAAQFANAKYTALSHQWFDQNLTERMRIDSSGNLLVGTTAVSYGVSGRGVIEVNGSSESLIAFKIGGGTTNSVYQYNTATNFETNVTGSRYCNWTVNGLERARIDSSGNLLVGTTTNKLRLTVSGTVVAGPVLGTASGTAFFANSDPAYGLMFGSTGGGQSWMQVQRTDGSATAYDLWVQPSGGNLLVGTTTTPTGGFDGRIMVQSIDNASLFKTTAVANSGIAVGCVRDTSGIQIAFNQNGSLLGTIQTNGSATAYNTSSDYRLKENVQPMTGALEKVAALKPVTYTWKADGSDGQGFIAHELQAVVPDCVTGTKDAVDENGKPQYQGVDTSFLVATLVAALQEQQALIQDLTTRLTALEGN
jgi:hypothetical protein